MNYLQFDLETENEAQQEMLIALLSNAGFESFEEEANCLKAYIRETEFEQQMMDDILKAVKVNCKRSVIKEQNWNEQWENSFEPVRIKDFVAVRAIFHEPPQGVKHDIIITPKMSFGTGHHDTTYLMIEQMSAMNLKDKTVLDFGTGTGILAILAEKLGANKITAIDNDAWSIENARENAIANGCTRINIQLAETLPENETFDLVLANINLNVILANLSAIVGTCKAGTLVLLSGFLKEDELTLFTAIARQGFTCETITQKGDWVCLGVTIH